MISAAELRHLYLELMKRCLTNTIYFQPHGEVKLSDRQNGRDWPQCAHTMIGYNRLDNIRFCMESILQDRIPGDVMETGGLARRCCHFYACYT